MTLKKEKEIGHRSSFLWHPKKETAEKIEHLCVECNMSVNALITQLAEYALERVTLKPRVVQTLEFKRGGMNDGE